MFIEAYIIEHDEDVPHGKYSPGISKKQKHAVIKGGRQLMDVKM